MSKNEESFNFELVIDQLLKLRNKRTELLNSNEKDAIYEIREINKELTRLVKLSKAYYDEQMVKFKNKGKNAK